MRACAHTARQGQFTVHICQVISPTLPSNLTAFRVATRSQTTSPNVIFFFSFLAALHHGKDWNYIGLRTTAASALL